MELIMVLRANTVAESLRVDWLSKVPWVSISNTATCRRGAVRQAVSFGMMMRSLLMLINANSC